MKNKGLHQYRFRQNPLEKKFAVAWEKQNISVFDGKLNGEGILDHILAKDPNHPRSEVTPRDRVVAASVIQWLGSPVGSNFIKDILVHHSLETIHARTNRKRR